MARGQQYSVNSDVHKYSTRNRGNLHIIRHRTQMYAKSVLHRNITLYNKLPICIRNIKSDKIFMKTVHELLIEGSYYCVEEFLADDLKYVR